MNDSRKPGRPGTPPIVAGLGLCGEPEPADAAGEAEARRTFARHQIDRRVIVTELDASGVPGASWECRAVDISRCGVGLRAKRMGYMGRSVFVEFLPERGLPGKLLFGVVRHSRYAAGEGYAVGVEFEKPPNTLAVRAWQAMRSGR